MKFSGMSTHFSVFQQNGKKSDNMISQHLCKNLRNQADHSEHGVFRHVYALSVLQQNGKKSDNMISQHLCKT
jgi:lipopolysaccharide export system protein LptC